MPRPCGMAARLFDFPSLCQHLPAGAFARGTLEIARQFRCRAPLRVRRSGFPNAQQNPTTLLGSAHRPASVRMTSFASSSVNLVCRSWSTVHLCFSMKAAGAGSDSVLHSGRWTSAMLATSCRVGNPMIVVAELWRLALLGLGSAVSKALQGGHGSRRAHQSIYEYTAWQQHLRSAAFRPWSRTRAA